MLWEKLKESGTIEMPDDPSTNDWIGDIDTDFLDTKIAEHEKIQAESRRGHIPEKEADAMENLYDRYSDADHASLDENTIDADFMPKARNADGSDPNGNKKNRDAWYKYSPFASQEDQNGDFMPDGFKVGTLEDGTVLYQLGKEKSSGEWFTDSETVNSCRDSNTGEIDLSKLKAKLQIKDDENVKNTLRVYKVDDPGGIKVAEGFAVENHQYGEGGGRQFFISPPNRKLSEIADD